MRPEEVFFLSKWHHLGLDPRRPTDDVTMTLSKERPNTTTRRSRPRVPFVSHLVILVVSDATYEILEIFVEHAVQAAFDDAQRHGGWCVRPGN